MKVFLLRHGRTAYNEDQRYQGVKDIPLSPGGEAELRRADFRPETVTVSPLGRARRTAELLFPGVPQIVCGGLREMDFGVFEGRSYRDMEFDPDYRSWVDGGCTGCCPGGESFGDFSRRACGAFAGLLEQALAEGQERLTIVAHGGVQMAVMERFALPAHDRFFWHAPCGGGYELETDTGLWRAQEKLRLVREVCYTKGGDVC